LAKGIAQGLIEGEARGFEEGRLLGIESGQIEAMTKIIRHLLQLGFLNESQIALACDCAPSWVGAIRRKIEDDSDHLDLTQRSKRSCDRDDKALNSDRSIFLNIPVDTQLDDNTRADRDVQMHSSQRRAPD
jgi:hypothetical protein